MTQSVPGTLGALERFSGKRVLVTGHTGFKGSWLSWMLDELGAEVAGYALEPMSSSLFDLTGLSRTVEHRVGDIRDPGALEDFTTTFEPQIVLHLAAQALVHDGFNDPVDTFDVNVMGTVNVLEAVRRTPSVEAVVVVTSDKCYAPRSGHQEHVEDDPMGGNDPYSASKGCAELVTNAYQHSYFADPDTANVASARAGNVIGGGDWSAHRLVPDVIAALQEGRVVHLRNADAIRPWQHVLDPSRAYLMLSLALVERGKQCQGGWNFGPNDDNTTSVAELTNLIVNVWGSGSWTTAPEQLPAPETDVLMLDSTKAQRELGYTARLDLRNAVKTTVDWYRMCETKPAADVTRLQIGDYLKGKWSDHAS